LRPSEWKALFWKVYTLEIRNKLTDAYQQYLRLAQDSFKALPTEAKTMMVSNKALPVELKPIAETYYEATYRGNLCQAQSGKISEARAEFLEMSKKTDQTVKNIGVIGGAICDVIELSTKDDLDEESLNRLDDVRQNLAEGLIFNANTDDRRADLFYWAGRACLLIQRWNEAKAYFGMVVERYPNTLISKAARAEFDKIVRDEKLMGE
jgi:tetratricopeptide (TPR) repeat protein